MLKIKSLLLLLIIGISSATFANSVTIKCPPVSSVQGTTLDFVTRYQGNFVVMSNTPLFHNDKYWTIGVIVDNIVNELQVLRDAKGTINSVAFQQNAIAEAVSNRDNTYAYYCYYHSTHSTYGSNTVMLIA